jgi:methionyl-tRNA formyltransferase
VKTCLVFAYSQLGHDCLRYLIEDQTHFTVVGVVTHDDNPSEHIWFDSVKDLALSKGIPVFTPLSLIENTIVEDLIALQADAIFSFYYRFMIPEAILHSAPLGAYNMHGSLLPKYRGRAPVNWAILNGESETGVTLHVMVAKADAGAIVDQAATPIGPDDTAGMVMDRLNTLAVEVLKRNVEAIANGTSARLPNDISQGQYFGGRSKEDGRIDWSWEPRRIHDLIRALQPSPQYPPAFGRVNGEEISFCKSKCLEGAFEERPIGVIVEETFDGGLVVACGAEGLSRIVLYRI